jgi:hypothetical protein
VSWIWKIEKNNKDLLVQAYSASPLPKGPTIGLLLNGTGNKFLSILLPSKVINLAQSVQLHMKRVYQYQQSTVYTEEKILLDMSLMKVRLYYQKATSIFVSYAQQIR